MAKTIRRKIVSRIAYRQIWSKIIARIFEKYASKKQKRHGLKKKKNRSRKEIETKKTNKDYFV